jgi:hypothetical protein
MKRRLVLLAGAITAVALLGVAQPAWSHDTGNEARTRHQCSELPHRLREACKACVKKKRPHHFHPENPPHRRCRPDTGRP